MRPTEILKSEHRVIEQVLTCLERIAEQARENGWIPAKAAADALTFFREFADGCHHRKEEDALFPMVELHGLPRRGPTEVMRFEHEDGRVLLRSMSEALLTFEQPDSVASFVRAARDYVHLLRAHIEKEEAILFTLADNLLTPAAQAKLAAQFETVEHEQTRPCAHEHCLAIAASLGRQFGVAPSPEIRESPRERVCIH